MEGVTLPLGTHVSLLFDQLIMSPKIWNNIDKFEDAYVYGNFNLAMAKAIHSLIHNLIECYKLDEPGDEETIKEILDRISPAFYWMGKKTGSEWQKMKVYQDRMV